MTLNLKTANQSSCITLWPMMMQRHSKFGYKRFSSWGDIAQMNIHWNSESFLWPWPWPWPQQNNSIFSQDNPAYDDVPSNQVWLQKGSAIQKISAGQTFINIMKFAVTLTLNKTIPFLPKTFWLKRISSSANIVETVIFWLYQPLPWPWPWK